MLAFSSDTNGKVHEHAVRNLPEELRLVAQDIRKGGLTSAHFVGRLSSEMSQIVLAVAVDGELHYDQATRFPGFERLPSTLRLWLEFVLLTRFEINSYRGLVNRTAVICYPHEPPLKLQHLVQPIGGIPIAALHGCRHRVLFRAYRAQPDDNGLEIGESCNTAARDLAMLPGVPSILDMAVRRGYAPRARITELMAIGRSLEDAKAEMRVEALAQAQSRIDNLRLRGVEYTAFPPAKLPRVNLSDSDFMRTAIYALRIWRRALRAEHLRAEISLLCRRHGTAPAEAQSQSGRLGGDECRFFEMNEERRNLQRAFRASGPVLPDYVVEFRTSDVASDLRAQAISTDEESTLLPADLVNRTDCPDKAYRMAIGVYEDWTYVARWETRCRTISSLKYSEGRWLYRFADEPEGNVHEAAPDEFMDQFHWTPRPLVLHRTHTIEPEDLQFHEHISADLSATKFDDSRWR